MVSELADKKQKKITPLFKLVAKLYLYKICVATNYFVTDECNLIAGSED